MAAKKKHDASSAPEEPKPGQEAAPEEAQAAPETPEEAPKEQAEQSAPQPSADGERYLRLLAEFDNYKKRSAKERENIYGDARADTVTRFLPVYDNLERAMKAECADESFKKGVEMTFNQLMDVFGKLGVEPIESVGQTFDPNLHNAVMHVEDEEKGDSEIVEEFQRGFKMGERVIRFSMVKVAN